MCATPTQILVLVFQIEIAVWNARLWRIAELPAMSRRCAHQKPTPIQSPFYSSYASMERTLLQTLTL